MPLDAGPMNQGNISQRESRGGRIVIDPSVHTSVLWSQLTPDQRKSTQALLYSLGTSQEGKEIRRLVGVMYRIKEKQLENASSNKEMLTFLAGKTDHEMAHLKQELVQLEKVLCGTNKKKVAAYAQLKEAVSKLVSLDKVKIFDDSTTSMSIVAISSEINNREKVNYSIIEASNILLSSGTRSFYHQEYRQLASRSGLTGRSGRSNVNHAVRTYDTIDGIAPEISQDQERLKRGVSAYIDMYSKRHLKPGERCPITADIVIEESRAHGFPLDLMLAQFALEGMGVNGVRVRETRNPGNFGNDDAGKNVAYKTWQEGIAAYCKGYYGLYCPLQNNVYGKIDVPALVKKAREVINSTK